MKKITVVLILITLFIFSLLFGEDIYYNLVDNSHWNQLNSVINNTKIDEIILDSELTGNEKSDFISNLNKAEFYKSNWRKIGPTGPVFTIVFKDGSKQYFEYFGNAIFETSYNNSQFLIKSIEIEQVLKNYNINLN